jgi:hypothetical protein
MYYVYSFTRAKGQCVGFEATVNPTEAVVVGVEDATLVMQAAERFMMGSLTYVATLEQSSPN